MPLRLGPKEGVALIEGVPMTTALAVLAAALLHRLMDPAVAGLNAQLSDEPAPQAGLTAVHKRAVGVAHELRRQAVPAVVGPVETIETLRDRLGDGNGAGAQ